jgi:hypothetical protein
MTRIRLDENDNALLARLAAAKHPGTLVATHTDAAWLMKVWSIIHRHPRRVAASVFPRKGGVVATETLGAIAANRAAELTCRRRGDELAASTYARIVELCIEKLPDWAK